MGKKVDVTIQVDWTLDQIYQMVKEKVAEKNGIPVTMVSWSKCGRALDISDFNAYTREKNPTIPNDPIAVKIAKYIGVEPIKLMILCTFTRLGKGEAYDEWVDHFNNVSNSK